MDALGQIIGSGRYAPIVPPAVVFLLAFFFAVNGTCVGRKLSLWFGVLDHPGVRKDQKQPVPLFGGVAIVLSTVLALSLSYGRTPEIWAITLVGVGVAMVGVLDDVFDVSAMVKLFALAAGCAVLAMYGIGLNRTPWPLLNFALTFLWVAGVASAFNAIDNKDGLAGVICFISAVSLLLFGWSTWQKGFAFLAAALAGSVLGFLHFNWPPARIYMGDAGSFFIGYVLAVLVIFGEWSDVSVNSLISGFLVVAVPVYDLALTTLLRIRHGVVKNVIDAIACSDSDHISHRLLALGVSHGGMLAIFGAIALLCSGVAAMVRHLSPAGAIGAAALLTLGFAAFGWYLDRNTSKPELWRQHARALHSAETSNDASAAR